MPQPRPDNLAIVFILALVTACGPSPTPPPTPSLSITVSPAEQAVAAGSSTRLRLEVNPHVDARHRFAASGLPAGVTAEFLGNPAPYDNTLIVHTPADLAPGRYVFDVGVTIPETPTLAGTVPIVLNVMACAGFQPGEFTRSMSDRPVTVIPAGKPASAEGLLVPLQVCGPAQEQWLDVTLVSAVSQAGTPMSSPPPFYLYRSLVWPAPEGQIMAHAANYWSIDVVLPRVDGTGWRLFSAVSPGLYLLVFERTRWGGTTAPADIPGTVTYRVTLDAGP